MKERYGVMNKEVILDYVKEHQPIRRSVLVKRFESGGQISRRNIYYHLQTLLDDGEIKVNDTNELVAQSPETKWRVPTVLANNLNITPIINAYGQRNELLEKLTREFVNDYGGELTKLLCDLIVLLNVTVAGYEFSHKIKELKPVSETELVQYFSKLRYVLDHKYD